MSNGSPDFQVLLERIPDWARWLLFLPGAIIAAILVVLVNAILNYADRFFAAFGFVMFGDWFLTPMAYMVATAAFIGIGSEIAPAARRGVAIFLTLFPLAILALSIYGRLNGYDNFAAPLWRDVRELIGMLAGVGFGIAGVFAYEHERSQVQLKK